MYLSLVRVLMQFKPVSLLILVFYDPFYNARFEEHTAVTTKNIVLWELTPYSLV